jgi:NitT/TauT family transport system substrate-binding protein
MKKLIFLFCMVLLVACQGKTDSSLVVGVLRGPSAISVSQWLYQEPVVKGQKIRVEIFDEISDLQAKMIQGKVDFAVLPTTVAAILYNKGVDYRMIACPVQGSVSVVSSDSVISFKDLKNRTVSVAGQGTTPDVLFTLLASKYGFRNKELQIDYKIGSHPDLAQAVIMGKVKTALLPEPFATMVGMKNLSVKHTISLSDELAKSDSTLLFAMTAFVVKESLIEKNHAMVDSVSNRYQLAVQWLRLNVSEAADVAVKQKILPNRDIALKSIPQCNVCYLKMSDNAPRVSRYLQIFFRFDPKTVGGKLPDKKFYYGI